MKLRLATLASCCAAILILGAGENSAARTKAVDSYCSSSGDLCTSILRVDGRIKLDIRQFPLRGEYGLCVKPANRQPVCKSFEFDRDGPVFESRVDFARNFPHQWPGRYTVSWHAQGSRIGPRLHFLKTGSLVFTRPDGSKFSFTHTKVSCGRSRNGGDRQAIFVDSIPSPYDGQGVGTSYFFLEGVLRDVAPSGEVKFPSVAVYGDPRGAEMFVFDPDDPKAMSGNELSSDREEASGKIVFHKARCSPRPRISFTIHASLGSEYFGLPNLEVDGTYRGVGAP